MINKGAQVVWNTAIGLAFLALLGAVTAANSLAKHK
jgi:hypothetical protein